MLQHSIMKNGLHGSLLEFQRRGRNVVLSAVASRSNVTLDDDEDADGMTSYGNATTGLSLCTVLAPVYRYSSTACCCMLCCSACGARFHANDDVILYVPRLNIQC